MKTLNHISRLVGPLVYKSFGLEVFRDFDWLKTTMHWTKERRDIWRLDQLGDILEFCWTHVPFYREFWGDHGLFFKRPGSLEELESYPILTREVYKANRDRIKADNFSTIGYIEKRTGGTTSEPLNFTMDRRHWAFMQAFRMLGWSQAGYRFGDPVGAIGGMSLLPSRYTLKSRLRSIFERKLPLLGIHMDYALARKYHSQLKAFGANYLYGYPSILSEFASILDEENLKLPELKAVITTAEMLQSKYKKKIEKLGCPVFDHLGSNDGGYFAYECNLHQGFHYNDLQAVLEVSNGSGDESGHLLITNLWNKSMPFIRFENGDLVSLSESPCPCGQSFPLIKSVEGRVSEILTFADGKTMYGPAIVHMFGGMDEVDGYQVVQRALDRVEIRIRSAKGLLPEHENLIRKVFTYHVGEQIKVVFLSVNKLEIAKNGKLRPVLVEFNEDKITESANSNMAYPEG